MLPAFLFGLALCLFNAPRVLATNYSVTPSSACNLADAIQAADTNAIVGSCPAGSAAPATDTINIGAGEYLITTSDLPTVTNDGGLSIIGASPATTTINGNSSHPGIKLDPPSQNNSYLISGVTLKGFVSEGPPALTGVIASYKGSLTVNNVNVFGNTCLAENLPVCVLFGNLGEGTSSVTLSNSSFNNNNSLFLVGAGNLGSGGALNVNFYNNTFSGNYGAVLNLANTASGTAITATLTNNTFANNVSQFPGSIFANIAGEGTPTYSSTIYLKNNIFYENIDSNSAVTVNCPQIIGDNGSIVSQGGNISNDNSCESIFGPNDLSNTDPLIGILTQDYDTLVRPLSSNSPAIGFAIASGSPSTDQRGVARPQNGSYDSGAYEYNGGSSPTPNPTPAPTSSSLVGTGTDTRLILIISSISIAIGAASFAFAVHHRKNIKK